MFCRYSRARDDEISMIADPPDYPVSVRRAPADHEPCHVSLLDNCRQLPTSSVVFNWPGSPCLSHAGIEFKPKFERAETEHISSSKGAARKLPTVYPGAIGRAKIIDPDLAYRLKVQTAMLLRYR